MADMLPAIDKEVNTPPVIIRYVRPRPSHKEDPEVLTVVAIVRKDVSEEEYLAFQNFLQALRRLSEVQGQPLWYRGKPVRWATLIDL